MAFAPYTTDGTEKPPGRKASGAWLQCDWIDSSANSMRSVLRSWETSL